MKAEVGSFFSKLAERALTTVSRPLSKAAGISSEVMDIGMKDSKEGLLSNEELFRLNDYLLENGRISPEEHDSNELLFNQRENLKEDLVSEL